MTPPNVPESLISLDKELSERAIQCELCTVGAAVIALVFADDPPTRNVKALFKPDRLLDEAAAAVATDLDLSTRWLTDTVRARLTSSPVLGAVEFPNLRVFAALPEYLLAMKCAAMAANRLPRDRSDIRFLLRFLNLSNGADALAIVHVYFTDRQLPHGLSDLLDGLLSA